jgi:hypothetical protein
MLITYIPHTPFGGFENGVIIPLVVGKWSLIHLGVPYFQTNPSSASDGLLKRQLVAHDPAMSVVRSYLFCTHHPSLVLMESDHRFQLLESPSSFANQQILHF